MQPFVCLLMQHRSYRSQISYEAVAIVEAGPGERHFCGPDSAPALDVEESAGSKIIGDHVLKSWCHTSGLRR